MAGVRATLKEFLSSVPWGDEGQTFGEAVDSELGQQVLAALEFNHITVRILHLGVVLPVIAMCAFQVVGHLDQVTRHDVAWPEGLKVLGAHKAFLRKLLAEYKVQFGSDDEENVDEEGERVKAPALAEPGVTFRVCGGCSCVCICPPSSGNDRIGALENALVSALTRSKPSWEQVDIGGALSKLGLLEAYPAEVRAVCLCLTSVRVLVACCSRSGLRLLLSGSWPPR